MKILLIVHPERADFYDYLNSMEHVEWVVLWHEKKIESDRLDASRFALPFAAIYSWSEFRSPKKLIEAIRPDRIVFFEIIDLRQIALNVCALQMGVPTFFLDHGAAGDKETAIARWKEVGFAQHKIPYFIKRLRTSLPAIAKAKLFYYSQLKGFKRSSSYLSFLLLPIKSLGGKSPNQLLSHNIFPERVPKTSIIFNRANFLEYQLYTGVNEMDVNLTGVPNFDKFCRRQSQQAEHIVYIDHPYYEGQLLNWSRAHHETVARKLASFAEKYQRTLYIKLHPNSDRSLWDQYSLPPKFIRIIQRGDFTDLYLDAKIILGYSSSLMTAFLCAQKNVVQLGWHPEPQTFGADFSKTGLCHLSLSYTDLDDKFEYWLTENRSVKNREAYDKFIQEFNYPFDGNASARVIQAIQAG